MKTVEDLVNDVLPYSKKVLSLHEAEFKSKMQSWVDTKGLITRLFLRQFVDVAWRLVVGPLLPVIVKVIIDVILGTTAPVLIPFIPLINKGIEIVSQDVLSAVVKDELVKIFEIILNYKASPEVMLALQMDHNERVNILLTQEIFSG